MDDTLPRSALLDGRELADCRAVLRNCIDGCDGLYAVILSSVDGNPVLSETRRQLPVDRIATMNSSMLALAETMARESGQRQCRFAILENSDGRLVSLRVNRTLLLTCVADRQGNLGMVLHTGQKTAESLAALL